MSFAGLLINDIPLEVSENVVSEIKKYFSQIENAPAYFDEWCSDLLLQNQTIMIMSMVNVDYNVMKPILSGLAEHLTNNFPAVPMRGEYNLTGGPDGFEVQPFKVMPQESLPTNQKPHTKDNQPEGMRLQDYLDRLTEDELEEFLASIEGEEEELRKFLIQFNDNQLCAIADYMNDTFNMPADDMDIIEFIVTLYKCKQADFYFYEDVQELFEDINNFMLECGDSI